MSKIEWDKVGEHLYETGIDRGVLYLLKHGRYSAGVPWNGLTNVTENTSGGEATPLYADNIKYLNLTSKEDTKVNVEAYSYPEEFDECIGEIEISDGVTIGQQKRTHFGFSYRSLIGNDVEGADFGYKLHLIFDCTAGTSDRSHNTINESPESSSYSWEVETSPVLIEGYKPAASLELDSTKFRKEGIYNVLSRIETILYGSRGKNPRFPSVSEIKDIFEQEINIKDSENDFLLDSSGNKLLSRVFC